VTASSGSRIGAIILANLRASPAKSAVLCVGFVVLVVLLVRLASGGAKSASADVPAIDLVMAPTAQPAPSTQAAEAWKLEPRLPRPRGRQILARDPFSVSWLGSFSGSTAGANDESAGELTLQMILTAGAGRRPGLAVISGMVVHPGSRVGRFEVVQIADRYVVLKDQAKTVVLRLP